MSCDNCATKSTGAAAQQGATGEEVDIDDWADVSNVINQALQDGDAQ